MLKIRKYSMCVYIRLQYNIKYYTIVKKQKKLIYNTNES